MEKKLVFNDKELEDIYYILRDWMAETDIFYEKLSEKTIELIKRAKTITQAIDSELS